MGVIKATRKYTQKGSTFKVPRFEYAKKMIKTKREPKSAENPILYTKKDRFQPNRELKKFLYSSKRQTIATYSWWASGKKRARDNQESVFIPKSEPTLKNSTYLPKKINTVMLITNAQKCQN